MQEWVDLYSRFWSRSRNSRSCILRCKNSLFHLEYLKLTRRYCVTIFFTVSKYCIFIYRSCQCKHFWMNISSIITSLIIKLSYCDPKGYRYMNLPRNRHWRVQILSTDKDFKQYTCTSSSLSASISHKNTFKWIDEDITRRSSTVSSESVKANVDCITINRVSKESSFSGSADIQVFHSIEAKSYIHVT